MKKYYCKYCNHITLRDSEAKTIKSYCDEASKNVRLTRIDNPDKIARELMKKFLATDLI